MVDVHSVAASSHPSCHERESERETTSRSRTGQSRQTGGCTDTTTVMLESQPQRTARMIASLLAAAGLDAALLAARQLLNNPPPSGASPSVAEQWHHDVDQLIVTTICATVALSISSVCAIRGAGNPGAAKCAPAGAAPCADGQLHDDEPQGGNQPPSRWRRQSHQHRAPPREASRYRGLQPRERVRPTCASGWAPSCTCATPP
jgi:hypothetical protein